MPGKLLVRGSINCDEFFELPHIVRPGETISSSAYSRRAGGKGANQSVAAAKAGAAVDFAGMVGHDGEWLRETLEGYGVGVALLGTDDKLATGRAIIQLSTSDAENCIVLFPGSNFSSTSPLSSVSLASSPYTHLLLQNEIPLSDTRSALAQAHEGGLKTILNPSPMLKKEDLEAFEWEKLDWLIINEGEGEDLLAALLAGGDSATSTSPEDLLRRLRATPALQGLEGLIMTRGSKGVTASLRGAEAAVEAPAGKVVGKVVDTTGAGDCFTGFFATLLATLPPSSTLSPSALRDILTISCQAAAICCETNGAMESVPTLLAVKERMVESWVEGEWEELLRK
ncbi:hypothetical protein JCM8097_001115 [Rhodosporidiobolus ruineniae]